jgi:hypothetical protein
MSREVRAEFDGDYETFVRAVKRAIRAGVSSRTTYAWVTGRRALGDAAALHNLPAWAKTGLPREIDTADVWISFEAPPLIEKGYSFEGIHRELLRHLQKSVWPHWLGDTERPGEIERMKSAVRRRLGSRQNLYQRLAALGFGDRPEI